MLGSRTLSDSMIHPDPRRLGIDDGQCNPDMA
jgi:hypothetical protein